MTQLAHQSARLGIITTISHSCSHIFIFFGARRNGASAEKAKT